MVHRQNFELPTQEETVEELSVDGGNIRVRTSEGEICAWLGYKAISLHHNGMVGTSFQDNQLVIDWVNHQPLASTVTCVGDGHDGIWNIIDQLASNVQRREVLDWFHLIENLHKVGISQKRLKQEQSLLWKGEVEATIALFNDCKGKQVQNFCRYLDKHRHHIINYEDHQTEQICSIGSGSVESAVKQVAATPLTVEQRFLGHNGNEKMCLKFLPIAVLISMDYCYCPFADFEMMRGINA